MLFFIDEHTLYLSFLILFGMQMQNLTSRNESVERLLLFSFITTMGVYTRWLFIYIFALFLDFQMYSQRFQMYFTQIEHGYNSFVYLYGLGFFCRLWTCKTGMNRNEAEIIRKKQVFELQWN
jgi:hypothetical protein